MPAKKKYATKKELMEARRKQSRECYRRNYEKRRAARKARDEFFKAQKDLFKRSLECANPDCNVTGFEKPKIIEFHHLDPARKNFNPHKATSWMAFLKEIGKCVPLCKDCHTYLEAWKKERAREKRLAELEKTDPIPF